MKKLSFLAFSFLFAGLILPSFAQGDPVMQRIVEIGQTDNRSMQHLDILCNRFGGRLIGSDAYENAAIWAASKFEEWGMEVVMDEVGELPIGFNRGPWFGKMVTPEEKALYFGTPSFTAGTKGVQRGPVVMLEADPFSIPGRRPSPTVMKRTPVGLALRADRLMRRSGR